jgi:hypothetical protein
MELIIGIIIGIFIAVILGKSDCGCSSGNSSHSVPPPNFEPPVGFYPAKTPPPPSPPKQGENK